MDEEPESNEAGTLKPFRVWFHKVVVAPLDLMAFSETDAMDRVAASGDYEDEEPMDAEWNSLVAWERDNEPVWAEPAPWMLEEAHDA